MNAVETIRIRHIPHSAVGTVSVGNVVAVDGVDITHAVTAVDVAIAPNTLPVVTLRLSALAADLELTPANVRLPDKTCAVLVALGWTPPPPTAGGGESS